jgi:two-component system KDP operon response regulator KdpE
VKVLLFGESGELRTTIPVILKVRWPSLSLFCASEARECLWLVHREEPCVVLLDFDSEPEVCFELISKIRSFSDVLLIVISQRDDTMDKVRALEMGADDWIVQSAVPMEFIAKVNALLRRCPLPSNDRLLSFLHGRLTVNLGTHQVCLLGKRVKLTPIEYKILWQLAQHEGNVVTREALLRAVWGPNNEADPEYLKNYIYRLRCKVEEDPAIPTIVLTERGVGYIMASSS